MNSRAYDIGTTAGILLLGIGAGLTWGVGPGLMVAGAATIALTLFTAYMAGIR